MIWICNLKNLIQAYILNTYNFLLKKACFGEETIIALSLEWENRKKDEF